MSATWRLRQRLRRPAQGQSNRDPAAVPSAPPRFGAAAATDVFFGAPRFGAAAAPEVFPGAPRLGAAAASSPPDPLAFFLPDCFWSVCYCNLVIGRSFSLCPDTLKPSPPPHLLHICFPPLAAPGHRQDLNPKSLVPKSRRATEMVKVHALRNVILAQGPTSVYVCVCLCACACALRARVCRAMCARVRPRRPLHVAFGCGLAWSCACCSGLSGGACCASLRAAG